MNWKIVFRIQGFLLLILSFMMIFPIIFSLYYKSGDLFALTSGLLITFYTGLALSIFCKTDTGIRAREGFMIVTLGWIFAALFSAIPFFLHGTFGSYIDCVFEAMSGFTTTGATILTDIESQPEGLLFWRSLTHWLGGMGIILLTIAILPILGLSYSQLYKAEVPGPTKDRISPRIKDTAKILWYIYFGMTILETGLLMLGGMNLYDALCHTFGTLATGGFSTKNDSIAGFNSQYIEIIIIIFMYLAGINFTLHFQLVKGNIKSILKNLEWRFYTGMLLIGAIVVTLNIFFQGDKLLIGFKNFGESLRASTFQVFSITTTTGFTTADFNLWPSFSKLLLVILMFCGGSAGSTGGGMKQIRIIILLKRAIKEIKKLSMPKAVFSIKIQKEPVQEFIVRNVVGFFILYMLLFAGITLFIAFMGNDIITSFSASIATLSNIGPGLAKVGAVGNYAFFDPASKIVLTFSMMLGRLELYSVLIFFWMLFHKE